MILTAAATAHRRMHADRERGVTIIELAVAMSLFGIIAATAFFGWRGWAQSLDEKATARSVVSVLRNAQQRSVSQGTTFCVHFDTAGQTWTMYQFTCGVGGTKVEGPIQPQGTATIASPSFTISGGATGPDAYFYPRGSATPGSVVIGRSGTTKTYTLTIEGLTGRACCVNP